MKKDDVMKKKAVDFKERGNKYSKWMKRGVEDAIKKKRGSTWNGTRIRDGT